MTGDSDFRFRSWYRSSLRHLIQPRAQPAPSPDYDSFCFVVVLRPGRQVEY